MQKPVKKDFAVNKAQCLQEIRVISQICWLMSEILTLKIIWKNIITHRFTGSKGAKSIWSQVFIAWQRWVVRFTGFKVICNLTPTLPHLTTWGLHNTSDISLADNHSYKSLQTQAWLLSFSSTFWCTISPETIMHLWIHNCYKLINVFLYC